MLPLFLLGFLRPFGASVLEASRIIIRENKMLRIYDVYGNDKTVKTLSSLNTVSMVTLNCCSLLFILGTVKFYLKK